MLGLDPEFFTIKKSKEMGLWPPSDIAADSVWPYISRLKKEKVTILDVGIMKGENAFRLLELDSKNKIEKLYGRVENPDPVPENIYQYPMILKKNIEENPDPRLNMADYNWDAVDVVCIDSKSNLDKTLQTYYAVVNHGGIFSGNEHHLTHVKEALVKFRRKNRIGSPIQISQGCWFWYKR